MSDQTTPGRRWYQRLTTRVRRTLVIGTTAAALAAAGLFGFGGLGTAQALDCPSYASKWVHWGCLSSRYTVTYKTRSWSGGSWERVSLRVGKFRGATYAYAVFTCALDGGTPCKTYDFDQDHGQQRLQIDGNSYGYDWGEQRVTIRSKYSRYTKALRSTSRSDVRFRACTWWWSSVSNSVRGKFCTTYW
ncbi:MAG: hypothetical protein ACRDTM_10665 [Micromonosporaceae bacterium]